MHKTFTFKHVIKELSTIIDLEHSLGVAKKARKAAKELGFSWHVFSQKVVVQDGSGRQTVYTHVKTPRDIHIQGLLLTHSIFKHKLH